MSSLPKQVQRQAEEVEALEQALYEQEPGAEAENPEGEPEQVNEQPAPEAVEPPVEPEAAKPEAPQTDEETWERRYKTLDGKYKAEVPRLFAEVKGLRSELEAARDQIDVLTRPKAAPEAQQKLVTDEDVETFGSDLVDLIDRKAREVAAQMVGSEMDELRAENSQLREQLSGVTERQSSNDRRSFFTDLERLVPDYEAVNVDEGFIEWLSEVDPLSGVTKQDYLNNAYASFDVHRTAALFNTYKQLTAPAPVLHRSPNLERQVAPGTSKVSTTTPAPAATRIWSSNEIENFYRQVAQGKFKGNEGEQVRIEAEIDLAVAQGRIR